MTDSVTRILRAAERVFAREGYHGATMRGVARGADVGLSLVVYHFETKQRLYHAIFAHRQYVNEQRMARLAAVDLAAPDALEQVVAAFVEPVVALHADPDDIWFARLVLRESADPSSQERTVIAEFFDPMARVFIAALRTVLPGKQPDFYHWAYLFSVGALTQSAFDTRVRNLSDAPHPEHRNALLRSYLVAALRYG